MDKSSFSKFVVPRSDASCYAATHSLGTVVNPSAEAMYPERGLSSPRLPAYRTQHVQCKPGGSLFCSEGVRLLQSLSE